MDSTTQALRKVREEITESRTWSKLQQELLTQIHHLEDLVGEGQPRTFSSLSTRDKLAAVDKAVKELGSTQVYAKLQAEITTAVDKHFSPLVFRPLDPQHTTTHRIANSVKRPLAEACSTLLHESPHLKHSLKNALNHPLHPKLRLSAWKLLLQYPSVQKDFLVTGKQMRPANAEERDIPQRCKSILTCNVALKHIAESDTALLAMQSIMLYWKRRTSSSNVLDSEFLLCVPFIHVWMKELDKYVKDGKGEGWLLFAEIAGEYVKFMEMLPPSIGSTASGESADGIHKFSQCVEELLCTEDPSLYKALQKLFKKATSKRRGHFGKSFHQALSNVLLSHVQKMLVGDLSMDVVCYIWDQCFMGLDVPEYQCLPYFTTVWLILLRDRLLKATSIEAVEESMSVHSHSLTTTQFQLEMEKRFLPQLSSLLKVEPIPLKPTQLHPPPILPQLQSFHSSPSHHLSMLPSHPSQPQTLHRKLPRGARQRNQSQWHTSISNTEIDLQGRIEEMQRRVEREQRILSQRMREEREKHQKQLEVLQKQLREIKMEFGREPEMKRQAVQEKPLAPIQISPSNQPALLLVDARQVSSIASNNSGRMQGTKSLKIIPVTFSSQQMLSSVGGRPFSPSNLTEKDVQTLWLKVLKRFTTAAYTICHGTDSEKQDLLSAINPSIPTSSS